MRQIALANTAAILAQAGAAHAAPPPLEAYGNLPAVEAMAISPGGNIATVTRIKGVRQLVVLDPAGNPKTQHALGDTKLRGLEFAGDDLVIVHNSAASSLGTNYRSLLYEFSGALIVPVLGGRKPGLVFGNSREVGDVVYGEYGLRRVGGAMKGYYSGVELDIRSADTYILNHQPALYEVDLAHNAARKIANPVGPGYARQWQIDESGRIVAVLDIYGSTGRWTITTPDNRALASGTDPTGHVGLYALGKDGSTIIYTMRDAQDIVRWFEVPLAGGRAQEVFTQDNIATIYTEPLTGRVMGMVIDGEKQTPVMYDATRQAAASKIFRVFGKLRTRLVDWTPDFSQVLVHTSGNGDSGTYFKVDVAASKADAIGFERPAVEPENVGAISRIPYTAADGLAMDGILTLPPGREARNLPVIVMPHGGPHTHDEPAFDWWAQAYASRGYAVFQPNFRGSTGRTDAFRNASAGEWGRKMQTDISDGLAELAGRGIVDPKRACIVGASYGGYAALAGVTIQHGLYRCAVAVAPVADLELLSDNEQLESGTMSWRSLRKELGDPKAFGAVSPRRHAAQADAPIMLIHGKEDTVVPFRQSDSMAAALRAAGKPNELVILRHEDHWLSVSDTRLQMLTESMQFVQKHNPAD